MLGEEKSRTTFRRPPGTGGAQLCGPATSMVCSSVASHSLDTFRVSRPSVPRPHRSVVLRDPTAREQQAGSE
jgi:hypothetical protein